MCVSPIFVVLVLMPLFCLVVGCSEKETIVPDTRVRPRLLSLSFTVRNNPQQLVEDVECEILGDSVVECRVRHLMPNKDLVATFDYVGTSACLNNEPATSSVTACNFSDPVKMTISNEVQTKEYVINVHSFTGLPVLWIETENRQEIVSKDQYINAHLRFEDNIATRAVSNNFEADLEIKGRGNSFWVNSPKKCFRLKFNKKVSFLNEPEDKAINENASYLQYSIIENESRWHVLNTFLPDVNREVWGSYNNEVQYLKEWLVKRMDWLNEAIAQM